MNRKAILCAGALAICAIPLAALAHHGWGWTQEEETRLSGEIVSISFGNPHMHIQLRANGGVWTDGAIWEVDLSPPSIGRQSGFGPEYAAAGDQIDLTGHRARDMDMRGFKAETITVRGQFFDVYPRRPKTLEAD